VETAANTWRKVVAVMTRADAQVLVCYDGSPEAEHAVGAAASLFGSRRAVVLCVAPAMTFAEGVAATSSVVPGNAFEDLNRADALRRAEAGAVLARRSGLDAVAQATIASGPAVGIVDAASEIDAAVIVVGSRGFGGLRELVRGSVSHDVAIHADRPVLIVPPARGAR
jgi:nucleotide-binding universal stress UspA family protein